MAMTYTSLTAAKGNAGAIATWTNYSKLDVGTIVDEAQALIYASLRAREMLASYVFSIATSGSNIALPPRFLDPIGRIRFPSINISVAHKDAGYIRANQFYTENSGSLGANPFTTASGSTSVVVNLTSHGTTQGSVFNTAGASSFNGVSIVGTFPVTSITDPNNFVIDIGVLGVTPNASSAGGGSSITYTCDTLQQGTPTFWGIWDEKIHFDVAFTQQLQGRLMYYQSPPLLSSSNTSNFLTNRYPQLMRAACMASAVDFMKDNEEYQKHLSALGGLVQQINIENDGYLRGLELDPYIP